MIEALLIIDIQNDYFEGGAMPLVGAYESSLKIKELLDQFREKSLPVIHIQHVSVRPSATFFLPDSEGVEIHNNVLPLKEEKVFQKNYPNSFRDTGLLEYLKEQKITHLVICGMMTHMCVDATTRAAKDFGFECTVIADACATRDLELNGDKVYASDVHTSFLAALNYFYASVETTKQFLEK